VSRTEPRDGRGRANAARRQIGTLGSLPEGWGVFSEREADRAYDTSHVARCTPTYGIL
jgi:hypothetical protein